VKTCEIVKLQNKRNAWHYLGSYLSGEYLFGRYELRSKFANRSLMEA